MNLEQAKKIAGEIISLYEKHGKEDYIGEPVSQLEHMCQAAKLAEEEGFGGEIILAAFLHDMGHFAELASSQKSMDGMGMVDHEKIASDFLLQKGFSQKICSLVKSHVNAKRYLTYKYPEYYQNLSAASKITLSYQGGVMDYAEAQLFESNPDHLLYLKLREWDDRAKQMHIPVPSLDKYTKLMVTHLLQQECSNNN